MEGLSRGFVWRCVLRRDVGNTRGDTVGGVRGLRSRRSAAEIGDGSGANTSVIVSRPGARCQLTRLRLCSVLSPSGERSVCVRPHG